MKSTKIMIWLIVAAVVIIGYLYVTAKEDVKIVSAVPDSLVVDSVEVVPVPVDTTAVVK